VRFIKHHIAFLLILLLCLLLRLIPLFSYQFTLDEWSGLGRTYFDSFTKLIEKGVKIDAHPAFVQVLLYFLVKFFGISNWIIKLPFLLFSIAAVIYAYAFMLRNFNKQVALLAVCFFSFSLIFVYHAPIARMYISGVFFSLALLYHFFEIVYNKNKSIVQYSMFGLFALLSALNQHINGLFALTVCAAGLLLLKSKELKPYILTCAVVLVLYLPHLPVTIYQLGIGGIGFEQGGWLPKPQILAVLTFLKVLFGTGRTYVLLLILVLLSVMLRKNRITLSSVYVKKSLLLLGLFLINYLIIYTYSVLRAPVYQHSAMLFSGTAAVLVGSSLLNFKNKQLAHIVLLLISGTLLYKTYYKKDYLHQSVKNIFEFQFEKTAEVKNTLGNDKVYPIFFDADTLMRDVCFNRGNYKYEVTLTKDSATFSLKHYNHLVSSLSENYLVLASADPLHKAIAKDYFPFLFQNITNQGINYQVYSKIKPQHAVYEDSVLHRSTFLTAKSFTFDHPQQLIVTDKGIQLHIDSLNEFPFAGRAALRDISDKEGQVILASAKLKTARANLKNVQLCIAINDIQSDASYYFTATSSGEYLADRDSVIRIYAQAYLGTDYNKIREHAKITVFVWNTGKENFTLSNLEIKTIDYWHQKWHFWD
jgi:hypothetical protein